MGNILLSRDVNYLARIETQKEILQSLSMHPCTAENTANCYIYFFFDLFLVHLIISFHLKTSFFFPSTVSIATINLS